MPQTIIDLDIAAPDDVGVKLGGKVYPLPGDIEIPALLKIERLMGELDGSLEGAADEQDGPFLRLYDEVLELFRIRTPELEDLPIGAAQLGLLVVRLYTLTAEQDGEGGDRPPKAGTKSTSKAKRSRSSRS